MLHRNRNVTYNHHIIRMQISVHRTTNSKLFAHQGLDPIPSTLLSPFHQPKCCTLRKIAFDQIIRAISNSHEWNLRVTSRDTARNQTNLISSSRLCLHALDTKVVPCVLIFSKTNFDSCLESEGNAFARGSILLYPHDSST